MDRVGIRKAGNAGLVITTLVIPPALHPGDLCHTMPTRAIAGPRTARITKIIAYNVIGVNVPLLFGTRDRAVPAAFVLLLPPLDAIAGVGVQPSIWTEEEIPAVEWMSDESAGAAGRNGNIYVIAGAAALSIPGIVVQVEIEEIGA